MAQATSVYPARPVSVGDCTGRVGWVGALDPTQATGYVGRASNSDPKSSLFARFALDVPKGATVLRSKVEIRCASPAAIDAGGTRDVGFGILEAGLWAPGGFTVANYPTEGSLPHPTGFLDDEIIPGKLFLDAWLGIATWSPPQMAQGASPSFGDAAYGATFPFGDALSTVLQAFVDLPSYDPEDPDGVGVGIVLGALGGDGLGEGRFFPYLEDDPTHPGPRLFVEWTDGSSSVQLAGASGYPRIRSDARGEPRVSREAASSSRVRSEPRGEPRVSRHVGSGPRIRSDARGT